jgi:adenylosuccinate lyase
MIERYSRPEMAAIWTLNAQYASWLEVELAVASAQAELGLIPLAAANEIAAKASFDPERIAEIEKTVGHDVIAFVSSVEEKVGPAARFLHFGLTSSDVLDTALALRLTRAGNIILKDLTDLLATLKSRAIEFRDVPIIGRSHGIHAEPTTFGLKLATFFAEFKRQEKRLLLALEDLRRGQISGPVGNYSAASMSPDLEERALAKLGLTPLSVSSQIAARDSHAFFFQTLALIATSAERLAVEIRHLARTEVAEVEEPFGRGQKGSSAMPHKKNPILAENVSGLARVVRGLAQASLDNVVLWHERDISHSSAERIIAPEATTLTDFILFRLNGLIKGLVVKPLAMAKNLAITKGLYNSQEILLALCQKGLTRTEAYGLVQRQALAAADGKGEFLDLALLDPEIARLLSPDELKAIFRPERFYRFAKAIFDRVFGDDAPA